MERLKKRIRWFRKSAEIKKMKLRKEYRRILWKKYRLLKVEGIVFLFD